MRSTLGNNNIVALGALACLALFPLCAQQSGKKSSTLRGKVEEVNTAAKRLTVTNGPIEGRMGSMTMGYTVDNEEVLNRVKAGDRITAKVYEGDFRVV
jgi:Cu/Ag efflux protein CusF